MTKYIDAASAATIIATIHGIPIADLVDTFADIPAADVAVVQHGRWIASHDEFCACSICKYPVYVGWNQTNYCPNCGCKMDKEEADDKKQPEEAPGE